MKQVECPHSDGMPCTICEKLAALTSNVGSAIDDLERGCELYCQWYDTGNLAELSGSTMAYEMVSAMRQSLSNLKNTRKQSTLDVPA